MPPGAGRRAVDVEDLLVRVKNGAGPELGAVAREVAALADEGRLGEDEEGGVLVPTLLTRLAGAGDAGVRALLMAALRRRDQDDKDEIASADSVKFQSVFSQVETQHQHAQGADSRCRGIPGHHHQLGGVCKVPVSTRNHSWTSSALNKVVDSGALIAECVCC